MTDERLKELNVLHKAIEQVREDINAIENGPYGAQAHHLNLCAVYQNDPATDYILTISEDSYPKLRDLILKFLKETLAELEKEFEEG